MKALLHCTIGNGLLYKSKGETKPFFYEYFKNKKEIKFWGKENSLIGEPLNGTVCAECDIDKVEVLLRGERGVFYPLSCNTFYHPVWESTKTLKSDDFLKRCCLTSDELTFHTNVNKGGYALYLSNVKVIEPIKIKNPPQSMRYGNYFYNGEWKDYLILSVCPHNLCNICNGLEDIETRPLIVNALKELIK